MSSEEKGFTTFENDYGGWPYNTILSELRNDTQMSATDFASVIVENYARAYEPGGEYYYIGDGLSKTSATMSACRVGNRNLAASLSHNVNSLANELQQIDRDTIDQIWLNTEYFKGGGNFVPGVFSVDLYDFASEVKEDIDDSDVREVAQNVKDDVSDYVIAENDCGFLDDRDSIHGLSIYFPSDYSEDVGDEYNNIDFSEHTNWDEFLNYWGYYN